MQMYAKAFLMFFLQFELSQFSFSHEYLFYTSHPVFHVMHDLLELLRQNLTGIDPDLIDIDGFARIVVDADNSCLFNSVIKSLSNSRGFKKLNAKDLRSMISDYILSHPTEFNKVVLEGKEPTEYCNWIKKPESWGGYIELNVR
jgi:hypothetical protein